MRCGLWILLSGLTAMAGCGPSPVDIVNKHEPAYRAKREQLQRIAKQLPPVGVAAEIHAALQPPLVLTGDDRANAEGLMFEQLTNASENVPLDLYLSDNLVTALHWTDPARKSLVPKGGDAAYMDRTMQKGLDLRYLVVFRVADLKLPAAQSADTFTNGHIKLEAFVVDLSNEQIVASFSTTAQVPAAVDYEYKEGESPERRLQAFAKSALWSETRRQVAKQLHEVTGGTVEID